MKKLLKSALLALALSAAFIGCAQPTTPGTDSQKPNPENPAPNPNPQPETPTPKPEKTKDELTIDNVKKTLSISTIITKDVNKIDLLNEKDGVTIAWASDKTNIIDTTGNVTHPEGTTNANVKLTATLSLNDKTATKEFTVLVYADNATLSNDEILKIAQDKLNTEYFPLNFTNKLFHTEIALPTSIDVNGTQFTVLGYKDLSNNSNVSLTNNTVTLTQDLVDYTVKIEAKLIINEEEKTATIEKNIPRITVYAEENNSRTVTFNTSVMEVLDYGQGKRYSYSLDTKNKIINLEITEECHDNNKWISIEKEYNSDCQLIDIFIALEQKPTLDNLDNIIETAYEITDPNEKDQLMANSIGPKLNPPINGTKVEGQYWLVYTTEQINEIKSKPENELATAIKAFVKDYKISIKESYGLTSDASWDDIKKVAKENSKNTIYAEKKKDSGSFKYSIIQSSFENSDSLRLESFYDSSKIWVDQTGRFSSNNGNSLDIEGIKDYKLSVSGNDNPYTLSFTDDKYTKFTYTNKRPHDPNNTPEKKGTGALKVIEKSNPNNPSSPIALELTFDNGEKYTLDFYTKGLF